MYMGEKSDFFLVFRERERCPSVCLSSVLCLSVTFVHLIQATKIFGNVSTPSNNCLSVNIQVKFYGDRIRETPQSGELNTRGEAYNIAIFDLSNAISETVQDRS